MSPAILQAPTTLTRRSGPVPIWPYILVCLSWNTWVVCMAAIARQRWGFTSPGLLGFVSACISVVVAAWFFFRNHHRRFLPSERWRFAFGCFFVFWFYDEFLRIAVMATHGGVAAKEVVTAILATLVDLALVWIIVLCIELWAVTSYGSAEDEPPPNNRRRGP